MSAVLFGASDDLVEVEGDVREEFNPTYDDDGDPSYVAFSTGVVASIIYGRDGIWAIRVLKQPAKADVAELVQARGEDAEPRDDEDGCPNYSDKLKVFGDVDWVVFGSNWAKRSPEPSGG